MKFLFSHRNFPGQFKHILLELSKNPENEIVFITGTKNDRFINGVKKYEYKLKREIPKDCHRYLRFSEDGIIHGQAAAELAIRLQQQGFKPDVIYTHAWGNGMFFKDIFPDTPLINFCEWYYNSENSDVDFTNKDVSIDKKANIRCKNANLLLELIGCDKGICPTQWQKSQFPKILQDKITVLHDGIDTDYFVPDSEATLKIPDTDLVFSAKDEIVTYATRGMEPYRGFPQFMKMAEMLLKKRPNTHVIIAGEDRVCYGAKLVNGSYKKLMLDNLDLDMSRVHFTGPLPYSEYRKLLQISSAHVYLTIPFVLSWSMLEAMSAGCCIVASKTAPVEEVMIDKKNGILTDFFNISELLRNVEYVLDNQDKVQSIREEARKTIVERYNIKDLLPKILDVIYTTAKTKVTLG